MRPYTTDAWFDAAQEARGQYLVTATTLGGAKWMWDNVQDVLVHHGWIELRLVASGRRIALSSHMYHRVEWEYFGEEAQG